MWNVSLSPSLFFSSIFLLSFSLFSTLFLLSSFFLSSFFLSLLSSLSSLSLSLSFSLSPLSTLSLSLLSRPSLSPSPSLSLSLSLSSLSLSLSLSQDDCLLKVWYPTTGWKSAVVMPDVTDKKIPAVNSHLCIWHIHAQSQGSPGGGKPVNICPSMSNTSTDYFTHTRVGAMTECIMQ